MYPDLKYLEIELPEDILKLKWAGYYDRAIKLIDERISRDIPFALKQRLIIEKDILKRMPVMYIYSFDEALKELQENIEGFTAEELQELSDSGAVDWIFIDGKPYFRDNILENTLKTSKDAVKRVKKPELAADSSQRANMLRETMETMKKDGHLSYRFKVRETIKPSDEARRIGEVAKVHLPLPLEYSQVKNVKILETSHTPRYICGDNALAKTIYFEEKLESDTEFSVTYEFETHMKYNDPKPEDVSPDQPHFYTEEHLPHIRFTNYIKELLHEIVVDEKNPLVKAHLIYNYITGHANYSFVRPYFLITDIPGYLATGWKGDCGIQALLFITLCRAAGIPARWQSGLYCNPMSEVGSHDWAEFYVAPFGWLYADCSFGGGAHRAGDEERRQFYFGNLDPFRIPANCQYQAEMYPLKEHLRNDPYDNQTGEIEYSDRGLWDNELVHTQELLSYEVIPYNK